MGDWDEQKIREMIEQGTSELGVPLAKAKKFAGAITIGVVAEALSDCGIQCSTGNVFIKTVPIEFDLVIPRPGITAQHGILYERQDILAVLEVKKRGSFGLDAIRKVAKDFRAVRQANPRVMCAYVTITEQVGYKHAVTADKIEAEAYRLEIEAAPGGAVTADRIEAKVYTLLWHTGSGSKLAYKPPTGEWDRLVDDLKLLLGGAASRTE